jgi:carboxypeptidase Taq
VSTPFEELRGRMAEVIDLSRAAALLGWDQQVMMPPRGGPGRAEQLAVLRRIVHEKFVSPEVGRLLEDLEGFEAEHEYDSFEASFIRRTRRDWEKARKVPTELRVEMARAQSLALPIWIDARKNNDFASFLPALQRNFELRREYIACFDGEYAEPYDVLLDDFEEGMTSARVRVLFDYLKQHQAPLVKGLAGAGPERSANGRVFPIESQKAFELEVAHGFGFDESAWRLDPTVHPFAQALGSEDIRVTTRYFEDRLEGLFGTMHETGHGLYEHQVDLAFDRTPLGGGVSLGFHESQSRMWENLVGRSLPFWRHYFPKLQETFPSALAGYDVERWYREVNAVRPSLIRVEADEATYNLHVILRFELEQQMIDDAFPLEQLPEEWNRRVWEYLGIDVPNDTLGVLQDTHWATGAIGYFSTYALGNLISAQLWERIVAEIPDLEEGFERGEFAPLREWLREHVHRYGRQFTPPELLERATGSKQIEAEPYVRYLQQKFGRIYGIPAAANGS